MAPTIVLAASLLALVACDGLSPSDAPFPSRSGLVERYGAQSAGQGRVADDRGGAHAARATVVSSEGYSDRGTVVTLVGRDIRLTIRVDGLSLGQLEEGAEVPARFDYDTGRAYSGRATFVVTGAHEDAVEAVFAGDLSTSGNGPAPERHIRVEGAFHAVARP